MAANSFIATKPLGDTAPSLSLAGVVVTGYLTLALAAAWSSTGRDA